MPLSLRPRTCLRSPSGRDAPPSSCSSSQSSRRTIPQYSHHATTIAAVRSPSLDRLRHINPQNGPPPPMPWSVPLAVSTRPRRVRLSPSLVLTPSINARRHFHDYFITHIPSSSLHPDSQHAGRPGHKLPRDASVPHRFSRGASPAASPPGLHNHDLTVVRIPLRRAKHHFGAASIRGTRPSNEDTDQAGTIDMPAFARRPPLSLVSRPIRKPGEAMPAEGAFGDPQIFYFGVFDGHGGSQCSEFLRDELHGYIEEASAELGLQSSLRKATVAAAGDFARLHSSKDQGDEDDNDDNVDNDGNETSARSVEMQGTQSPQLVALDAPGLHSGQGRVGHGDLANELERGLVAEYRNTVGGYFRRFRPDYFDLLDDGAAAQETSSSGLGPGSGIESILMYAFLRADLDFVTAQARKPDPDDPVYGETPVNNDEILGAPHSPPSGHLIGGRTRFKGGSTASVALISTPTPAPFWHPAATATLVVAHVGDSRVLVCETATGLARPLTSDHHPSTPVEQRRLLRYGPQGSMVSGDSFGEKRITGLANSRAFGDMRSKRVGVSAEPEMTRLEMGPAQYSFLVLMSDGVSGCASDQEIVDLIKEARTPDEGARKVVEYAAEVSTDGDNATCLVVRLGGWERRSEGGLGSLGTKEMRDVRLVEALDPRRGKR